MAVGATAGDILKLILAQGTIPLAFGPTTGLIGSLAVNRLLQTQLVNVSPSGPITIAVASATLIFAALLGCGIPARRALRVDPIAVLPHE